ncbi:MAG: hypothetical protein KF690_09360 [Bacteroidetes bacterium]|nr:hypothetical protein [Bacteroidota bacterium]
MRLLILLFVMALLGTATPGLAQTSTKQYKWKKEDEDKLTRMCLQEIIPPVKKEMPRNVKLDEYQFCGCMLDKVKYHFKTYEAVRNSEDSELGRQIGSECAKDALTVTGDSEQSQSNWSEEDETKLSEFCYDIVLPMIDGKLTDDVKAMFNKDVFCSCMHDKVVEKFDTMSEFISSNDENFNVSLGQDCALEAMKKR